MAEPFAHLLEIAVDIDLEGRVDITKNEAAKQAAMPDRESWVWRLGFEVIAFVCRSLSG